MALISESDQGVRRTKARFVWEQSEVHLMARRTAEKVTRRAVSLVSTDGKVKEQGEMGELRS